MTCSGARGASEHLRKQRHRAECWRIGLSRVWWLSSRCVGVLTQWFLEALSSLPVSRIRSLLSCHALVLPLCMLSLSFFPCVQKLEHELSISTSIHPGRLLVEIDSSCSSFCEFPSLWSMSCSRCRKQVSSPKSFFSSVTKKNVREKKGVQALCFIEERVFECCGLSEESES